MNVKDVVSSQYRAALRMLELAVERCPDGLWHDDSRANPTWRVAFHALFYTHLYLQDTEADFAPWERHRGQSQFLGTVPWPPFGPAKVGEPYTQADILDYAAFCRRQVDLHVATMDFEAPSGFDWLPFGKLELQLYNIRHLQQHAGELMERLAREGGIEVDWVGMG